MAQRTVYVCDACGQPRLFALSLDIDQETSETVDEIVERTTEAHVDLCVTCLAAGLKWLLPHLTHDLKRAWHAMLLQRGTPRG